MSTIAAIGTALGSSGISIIRISGEKSKEIISKLFTNYKKLEPNSIIYGKIKEDDTSIDKVLVSYFKAPNSFTGEDIIEINCHGGTYITKKILELVLKNGAKLAEPGEFSKRAFLNGKIDLSEAESIIDLINSKTKLEAKIASNDINGKLYGQIRELREKLIEVLAHIEVSVDYPEYDYDEVDTKNVTQILDFEIDEINKLILSYDEGKYIKNGINVAILGRPNVGKSSLLNCLANYDRAIVTDIAGTTRDTIDETINIGDVILNITDTAGIRDTDDIIEKIGVDKSIKKLDEVDLVIYMLNAEKSLSYEDKELISKIIDKNLKNIVVINKTDICSEEELNSYLKELKKENVINTINISVKENKGIDLLKEKIVSLFLTDSLSSTNEIIIVNERHKNMLNDAITTLKNAREEIKNNMPVDIISIEIKESARKLGEIIGSDVSSDVVHKIFEKFCLGK